MVGRGVDSSNREILVLFEEAADPVLGTSEVADALDYSDTGMRDRLYRMADEGLLAWKKIGNSPAFWITDRGREYLDEIESNND